MLSSDFKLLVFDPFAGGWTSIDLKFLEQHLLEFEIHTVSYYSKEFHYDTRAVHKLTAAAGGMLLFSSGCARARYTVCNPLSKCWRRLPDLPYEDSEFTPFTVQLVADKTGSYKILVVNSGFLYLYDSISNSWSETGRMAVFSRLPEMRVTSVMCGDVLYAIYYGFGTGHLGDCWHTTCPVVSGQLPIPLSERLYLVESGGRLFLVGSLGSSETGNLPEAIGLWEFTSSTPEWKELGRIPQQLLKEFFAHDYGLGIVCMESGSA